VVGGTIGVPISDWLLICTTLLALFLGFSKRRHELGILGAGAVSHRQVLTEYSRTFLDMMIGVVTACTVMSYALYTVSEETVRKFNTRALLLTLPFVLYGIFGTSTSSITGQAIPPDAPQGPPTLINLALWPRWRSSSSAPGAAMRVDL
jgi:hypothetical protein